MIPPCLTLKGTVGICSPSHIALPGNYERIRDVLCRKGFSVVEGDNLYKDTDGYLASPHERADDFNRLIADPDVELVFFGGGEGSVELIPYIDFDNIRRHPKCILSYSDGTTILNTIWSRTGLETYYGQSPHMFMDLRSYDYDQFVSHLVIRDACRHVSDSSWQVQTQGKAEGILVGGYSRNFALLLGSPSFSWSPEEQYVLFLEDHERFGGVDYVSAMLSNIEQQPFFRRVTGLLFGRYSDAPHPFLLHRLERLGQEWEIPVVYCGDFGHNSESGRGGGHAILPIGRRVRLETERCILRYL